MARKTKKARPGENIRGPTKPNPALLSLSRFVGAWRLKGSEMTGAVTFTWFQGGFFLVQTGWIKIWGRRTRFIEFIGYDEARRSCTSRLFDNFGDRFTYEWGVDGNDICISFGQKGSGNSFTGSFSEDGNAYAGRWRWPGGGYEVTAKRVRQG